MADQIYKRTKKAITRERSRIQKARSQRWLFVCEGSKTEPQYVKSLIDFYNKTSTESDIIVDAYGEGRNTVSLVKSIDDFLASTEEYKKNSIIPYEKVFVMFDKDSFGANEFNAAIRSSMNRGYIPIWSNECFELWYLLHFEYFQSDSGRELYFDKLSHLLGMKYDKADHIFEKIHSKDRISLAYNYSKKLINNYKCEKSPSKMVPCTQMPVLIDMLEEKLRISIVKNN